jgi:hypothetical protein
MGENIALFIHNVVETDSRLPKTFGDARLG